MTVLSEIETHERIRAHQAEGRRVVLTNGAFDLLHVGHVRVLEAAAACGDVLVVAVNADATVRRAKGVGRPVVPAIERVEVVSALGCVDHVLLFADETMDRLLEYLRPDVHAKGRDYDGRTLPERAVNERLGIEMAFVGDEKVHASSSIMSRAASAGAPTVDRIEPLGHAEHVGFVNRRVRARLEAEGWLDLGRLVDTQDGEVVERHSTRWVRRLEVAGSPVYLKVTRPFERGRSPIVELQNHLALRAVGLRAPEPWVAIEGKHGGDRAGVLLTREAPGVPLDRWLADTFAVLSPRERLGAATGVGVALRALHTARFLHPDLQAWHWLVDGDPSDGARAVTWIDLQRVERAGGRIGPKDAARGLAALALSVRRYVPDALLLAALRAYLGGSLRASRKWLLAIDKQARKLAQRGTFRDLDPA